MGVPKHGKLSSRSQNSARYMSEGRRIKNKAKNIASQIAFALKQQEKRKKREVA